MRKTKICAQEKLHTVKNILHGTESIHAAAKRLSVAPPSVRAWIGSLKGMGSMPLRTQRTNTIPMNVRFRR